MEIENFSVIVIFREIMENISGKISFEFLTDFRSICINVLFEALVFCWMMLSLKIVIKPK